MYLGYTETADIQTGNVSTVNDPYSTSRPNNGALMTPGQRFAVVDSSGRFTYYRYVRLSPTTPPSAYIVGPVYWKDNTKTVVTTTMSDGLTATANSIAGVLMNAQATASVLTGNWVVIQVEGYLTGMAVVASTVKSDILIGATGDQVTARVASGTAATFRPLAIALTDRTGGGLSDVDIVVENY